ncbi:MAG: NAD(P)/FAD-dependent oxidoreductase [Desulfobacterales bacterium]
MEDQTLYDVVIFGTGPAGLQAAIHAARAKVRVLVMGRKQKSSLFRAHVENYCCMGETSGEAFLLQGIKQASSSGADFLHEDIIKSDRQGDLFTILAESEQVIKARTLIIAMGVTRNRLGIPGEKEFFGKGVSYCVDCDANFFRNETVAVVGNESAAVSGALTLLFYAKNVHLVSDRLEVADRLAFQVEESDVQVHSGRRVKEIIGRDSVEGIVMDNHETINVNGVFIETGAKGAVELASSLGVALDDEKFQFIVTDKNQKTNVEGIYAAGDICGPPWQVAKAVGEGCVAGLSAAKYAKKMR